MQGIMTLKSGVYLFRDDHHHEKSIWAWELSDEISPRVKTHKWKKVNRKRVISVELFNLDAPPQTVGYQPLIGVTGI